MNTRNALLALGAFRLIAAQTAYYVRDAGERHGYEEGCKMGCTRECYSTFYNLSFT